MPSPQPPEPPLIDTHGRLHRSLRLSVTDRCNIRCFYCMPAESVRFLPKPQILSFEEVLRVTRLFTDLGIDHVRITGGEPLMRRDLPQLIAGLQQNRDITDLALTTNGMMLAPVAAQLREAGLQRINISLDTLDEATFQKISRRPGLDQVLAGIDAASKAGFPQVRLNALAIRGWIETEAKRLVDYAHSRGLVMRFIEYMPLDADRKWERDRVLPGKQLLQLLSRHFGTPTPIQPPRDAQPARDFEFPGGVRVGLICPVTEPFCQSCDRLRLTAEGAIRNCLFSTEEWSLRDPLRRGAGDDELKNLIRECVTAKRPGHLIAQPQFEQPKRAMYQIGG